MKCKWNDFENGDWVDLKLEMDESEMQLKLRKINSAHGFTPKSVLEEKKLILIFFLLKFLYNFVSIMTSQS